MFARFFIDRPIFAAVLSILVTLGGLVGLARLPVALYPDITPPSIEVSTTYPGAHALTLGGTVAAPIEENVNGVENMLYMTSTSANDGSYSLLVTFKPGTNLNIAQVLVQNRVNIAVTKLPAEVRRRGVTVKKKAASTLMIVNLYSPSRAKNDLYLSNYATIQLRDELARLDGVGDIQFLGQRDYSMRIWVNPIKMANRNISAEMVTKAIEQQNTQVAAGQIGQPPVPTGQAFQFTINTRGRLIEPEQFEDIVLKTEEDNRLVRLRDVTDRIELGAAAYDQTCTLDGRPSVALSVYQLPGSNALETARRVKEKMAELQSRFPVGVEAQIVYDTTPFIEESVNEVFSTLRDAVILVAIVMLVFLQNWRSAIIPLAAVPVAIIGTFGFMALAGFSLNTLTLFGLVLAVGIVVDDAIVVVEAVEYHIAKGLAPKEATAKALGEVAGPVIAVGLVLSAVFVPCVFITGIVGEFFRQFAVTIAISTLLSAFNSLTLSPALCGLLLKPHHEGDKPSAPLPKVAIPLLAAVVAYFLLTPLIKPIVEAQWQHLPQDWALRMMPLKPWVASIICVTAALFAGWIFRTTISWLLAWSFRLFNQAFELTTLGYLAVVRVLLRVSPVVLVVFGGLIYLTTTLFLQTPTGFIPVQDKGYLIVNLQLTDSASLSRSEAATASVDAIARQIPGVSHTVSVAGQSAVLGGNASNFATVYVMLDDFSKRRELKRSADFIAAQLQQQCRDEVPRAIVTVFPAPPVDGLGAAGGYRLMIEDRLGADTSGRNLQTAAEETVLASLEAKELTGSFSGFRADTPWLELTFDCDAAESLGVNVLAVLRAVQQLFGSEYVNDFNRFGRTWQVTIQADQKFRTELRDLFSAQVPNERTGEMVPVKHFFRTKEVFGPTLLIRHNLHTVAPVTTNPSHGASSGEAMDKLESLASSHLEAGMKTSWTELALLQRETGNTALWAFALSVLLVFLVLAAQYESWTLPLAVILVVPMCLLSAIVGIRFAGNDINIFTQIGFVVLVGLASKNAILIVEFARAKHAEGMSVRDATLAACRLRLRPIIMTSVAFILGVLPLVIAEGAGSEMRRTLGTAVFAGMIGVTLFGIFLTPVFYFVIQWCSDRISGRQHLATETNPAASA